VFSYTYCSGVLGRIEERVPQIPVFVAAISTLVSIAAGLYLMDFMAKELRPVRILARTAEEGLSVIAHVYPSLLGPGVVDDESGELPLPAEAHVTLAHTGRSGIVLAFDTQALLEMARRADRVIELVPQIGDFIPHGGELFRVYPDPGMISPDRLRASVDFGHERTSEQDPAFVFRILVDVAARALSPAINDPTTAVLALDQVHHLLRQVGARQLDTSHIRDDRGKVRVTFRTPNWQDFVMIAATEIRIYGAGSIQIARRLRVMLEDLLVSLPAQRAPALREQLHLLAASVERAFCDPEDRQHACTGDYQGVGSSRDGEKLVEHKPA
jgi:uncharacterized membrane protein